MFRLLGTWEFSEIVMTERQINSILIATKIHWLGAMARMIMM